MYLYSIKGRKMEKVKLDLKNKLEIDEKISFSNIVRKVLKKSIDNRDVELLMEEIWEEWNNIKSKVEHNKGLI